MLKCFWYFATFHFSGVFSLGWSEKLFMFLMIKRFLNVGDVVTTLKVFDMRIFKIFTSHVLMSFLKIRLSQNWTYSQHHILCYGRISWSWKIKHLPVYKIIYLIVYLSSPQSTVEWSSRADFSNVCGFREVASSGTNSGTRVLAAGLTRGRRYFFRAAAGNIKGWGTYSVSVPRSVVPSSEYWLSL